jgi:hypothetical protein
MAKVGTNRFRQRITCQEFSDVWLVHFGEPEEYIAMNKIDLTKQLSDTQQQLGYAIKCLELSKIQREQAEHRIQELEDKLNTEMADHTREVLRSALLKHKLSELEELFKVSQHDIKEIAQQALGYEQTCDAKNSVCRLADAYKAFQAQYNEERNTNPRDR